jgi:alpha-N-arabinofuranosidase
MANIAPLVNTRGPLYVHPEGIVKRTHFHTLEMYANLLGSHMTPTAVEDAGVLTHENRCVTVVDAIATTNAPKDFWSVALVNRHPSQTVDCTVKLNDKTVEGAFEATILASDSPEAYNDIEHPERVMPEKRKLRFRDGITTLPPHSLSIVRLPGN